MAGEGDIIEALNITNSNAACNFNLSRLRERVKEYVEKVHYFLARNGRETIGIKVHV